MIQQQQQKQNKNKKHGNVKKENETKTTVFAQKGYNYTESPLSLLDTKAKIEFNQDTKTNKKAQKGCVQTHKRFKRMLIYYDADTRSAKFSV